MTEQEKDINEYRKHRKLEERSHSFFGMCTISESALVCLKWDGSLIMKIVL
ncbi:hypothetical protein [Bacillus swezeyi]|uniref:hypothetical protein n=1 Tax=Bacillus swezeyi TaxID=1925020 RepID=UPI0027DAB623|nr:hypothetical protein [Bacillus swezeyi]